MISGTSRLSGLWPPFASAVEYLLAWCDYYGLSVSIVSGYRSNAEQSALYAQGRTPQEIAQKVKKRGTGGSVTDAGPGESAHNYGLAIDIESEQLPQVMALARALGFGTVSWDADHLEWPNWHSLISWN